MTTPQTLFLENEDAASAWRTLSRSRSFENAVAMALAEYATTRPNSQELVGALNFIRILTDLGEKPPSETAPPFMPRLTPPEQLVPKNYGLKSQPPT